MDKKIICIFGAVLLILLPVSSVVGTNIIKTNVRDRIVSSPLFAVRNKSDNLVKSNFLGKDNKLNIFLSNEKNLNNEVNKVLKFIGGNPVLSNQVLDKLETNQIFINLLEENDISISEFKTYLYLIKNDPSLLEEKIRKAELEIPESVLNSAEPLSLETTNPIGCFITAFVLAIVAVVLALIISTITIITCLNINGCFELIGQRILDSMAQGLIPPVN